MFGQTNQTAAAPTVQNPSMLDNLSVQDFQTTDDNQQTSTQSATTDDNAMLNDFMQSNTQQTTTDNSSQNPVVEHPITTDNPFVQDPATVTFSAPANDPQVSAPSAPIISDFVDSASASVPYTPPPLNDEDEEEHSNYLDALTEDQSSDNALPAVDHDKLADMKQQALAHLEPLADHLDGTPEETFKTTMMMIQANDNHTLLEKALESAKKIEDGKARAQAMLDIINEINYFSQQQ